MLSNRQNYHRDRLVESKTFSFARNFTSDGIQALEVKKEIDRTILSVSTRLLANVVRAHGLVTSMHVSSIISIGRSGRES